MSFIHQRGACSFLFRHQFSCKKTLSTIPFVFEHIIGRHRITSQLLFSEKTRLILLLVFFPKTYTATYPTKNATTYLSKIKWGTSHLAKISFQFPTRSRFPFAHPHFSSFVINGVLRRSEGGCARIPKKNGKCKRPFLVMNGG